MTIRALDLLAGQPWAITQEGMDQILLIAQRLNDSPEAVATRLGRPLDNARKATVRGDAALIPITGPIFRRANLFTEISGATSVEVLATDIQAALDNPAVKRLVLEIDSPGGQATGIAELAALIHASPKPVTAFVDGMAASAAYWIAAAADRIVMSSTALVGSIGVVATYSPGQGKEIKVISSQSPLKQATPDTEHGRAETQRVVDELAAVFISDVARYRGTDPDTVQNQFGQGGILVGQLAVAAGMADAIGTYESLFTHAHTTGTRKELSMTYQADMNAALGLPADASAEEAIVAISNKQADAEIAARAAGRTEGAEQERARVQSVRAQHIPGHEALIERLAFDGVTTGPEAAVAVLAAERGLREAHQAAQAAAPAPVVGVLVPQDQTNVAELKPKLSAADIYTQRRAAIAHR